MDTISSAAIVLDSSITQIGSADTGGMLKAIVDAQVDLTATLSGTYNEDNREIHAGKMNEVLEMMVSFANWEVSGQYLFGGSNTSIVPYAVERTNGEITSVTYQGSFQQRNIEVAPGVQSNAYYVGEDLFCSDNRSTPVFVGDTGAAVGSGTASVKGDSWLTVTDDGGGSYDLTIDDGATTVNVAAAPDITNIAVTNADGDVLYVNATNIDSTGVEMVTVAGTYNIFDTFISARDLLRNVRGLLPAQLDQCRDKLVDSLEEIRALLVEKETSMGSKINFINDLKISLEDIKFNVDEEATVLQETDIAQVAIDLSRREVLYQMSLSVTAKLMSMSLLDFIK